MVVMLWLQQLRQQGLVTVVQQQQQQQGPADGAALGCFPRFRSISSIAQQQKVKCRPQHVQLHHQRQQQQQRWYWLLILQLQ
jgi:hypothetical protein